MARIKNWVKQKKTRYSTEWRAKRTPGEVVKVQAQEGRWVVEHLQSLTGGCRRISEAGNRERAESAAVEHIRGGVLG
jgi:hypothetical protein